MAREEDLLANAHTKMAESGKTGKRNLGGFRIWRTGMVIFLDVSFLLVSLLHGGAPWAWLGVVHL